jgi:class 3 adenylate cyclase
MTREEDKIHITNKIVVTIDIHSSSQIIEDLLKTNSIKLWRDLLITINEYLKRESIHSGAAIYKFIGDGWILLFNEPYSAKDIFKFLSDINKQFDQCYSDKVFPKLDTPSEISGLTFGIDEGQLINITMQNNTEYIGRPINIACRLQGAINDIDIKDGYRVFISHRLYNALKDELSKYYPDPIQRPLRNISEGRNFRCNRLRLLISNIPFTIIEARYGTDQQSIDVKFQYSKKIINGKLDVVVSNEIAESDPQVGIRKKLKIKYVFNGEVKEIEIDEGSRVQLP